MNWITDPWPWYISGPLIGLTMITLLLLGKQFGISSTLRTSCTMLGAGRVADFFRFDWKAEGWNLMVVAGAVLGGYLAANYLGTPPIEINPQIALELAQDYGISDATTAYLPGALFPALEALGLREILFLVGGGLLVGFGARYAGGCTSGHAISGLSNLQIPSLIAVLGFFIGGLTMVYFLFPLLF